jgi:NTP pyrophosphatase (non-canonical NTP hydrolase)
MIIELRAMQLAQLIWRVNRMPVESTVTTCALGVAEETGELCHSILKMEQGIRGTTEKHLDDIHDSIGDITIYLLDLCNVLQINFDEVLEKTWAEVSQRDWIKYPFDGRAK